MRILALPLLATLALAGCAGAPGLASAPPPLGWATLPDDANWSAADPTRSAILATSYTFGTPSSVANRPAEAARVVAQLEYLAVQIPTGPRFGAYNPLVVQDLPRARDETRAALGISPNASSQAVIDALSAAARDWRSGNPAAAGQALSTPAFPNPAATAQRLASLPTLPVTASTTSRLANEMNQQDSNGSGRDWD